jgi:ferritin-like metal-binding protein YciE
MLIDTLSGLFLHTLKEALYAKRRVLCVLPELERRAGDARLKSVLACHCDETEAHVSRVEEVFDSLGKPARGVKCDALAGLLDEAEGLMARIGDAGTMDAALISVAQMIEHYEIGRNGTLLAWSQLLGHRHARKLLAMTLIEEKRADRILSRLATRHLNAMAAA